MESNYLTQLLLLNLSPLRFKESPEYGLWMVDEGSRRQALFMMRGHLGQYVLVEPNDNIIIVRLGHQKSEDAGVGQFSNDITVYIEEAYKMMGDALKN